MKLKRALRNYSCDDDSFYFECRKDCEQGDCTSTFQNLEHLTDEEFIELLEICEQACKREM